MRGEMRSEEPYRQSAIRSSTALRVPVVLVEPESERATLTISAEYVDDGSPRQARTDPPQHRVRPVGKLNLELVLGSARPHPQN